MLESFFFEILLDKYVYDVPIGTMKAVKEWFQIQNFQLHSFIVFSFPHEWNLKLIKTLCEAKETLCDKISRRNPHHTTGGSDQGNQQTQKDRRFSRQNCAWLSGSLEIFHEIRKFYTQSCSIPQYSHDQNFLFISSIVRDPKACFFQIMKSFTQKKRYREPKRHKSRRHRNYKSKWALTKQIWKIVQNCPRFWSQTRFYQIPSTNWNIAINNISKIWWAEI